MLRRHHIFRRSRRRGVQLREHLAVISPFAKAHTVSHTEYNFGSILKFIETTVGIGSLGTTDAPSNSISDVFDFAQSPNVFTPAPLPHANACADSSATNVKQIIKRDGGAPD